MMFQKEACLNLEAAVEGGEFDSVVLAGLADGVNRFHAALPEKARCRVVVEIIQSPQDAPTVMDEPV